MRGYESLGVVLQVGGLAVTGIGVWRTWHALPPGPGERFLDPIVKAVKVTWAGVGAALRWLGKQVVELIRKVLRRPRPVEIRTGGAEAGVLISAVGHGRMGFGSLPGDTLEALAELDRRTRVLLDRVQDADDRHTGDVAALRDDLIQLQEDLEKYVHDLAERDRQLVVSGIRWEVFGLLLIGLGVVVQWGGAQTFG